MHTPKVNATCIKGASTLNPRLMGFECAIEAKFMYLQPVTRLPRHQNGDMSSCFDLSPNDHSNGWTGIF